MSDKLIPPDVKPCPLNANLKKLDEGQLDMMWNFLRLKLLCIF